MSKKKFLIPNFELSQIMKNQLPIKTNFSLFCILIAQVFDYNSVKGQRGSKIYKKVHLKGSGANHNQEKIHRHSH